MKEKLEGYEKLAQLFKALHEATQAAAPTPRAGTHGRIEGARSQQSRIRELNTQAVELGLDIATARLAEGSAVEANALVQLTKTFADGASHRIQRLQRAVERMLRDT